MGRRAWIPVLASAITILSASIAPLAAPMAARAADSDASVKAWIEVDTTHPAPGCTTTFAVEIRSNGDAVAGASVEAALFANNSPIDVDTEATDDGGVAHLTADTSNGEGDWVDINVNGTYLTGFAIAAGTGSSCEDTPKSVEVTGSVAVDLSASAADTSGSTDSSDVYSYAGEIPSSYIAVPFYKQERNLSCEYAAIQIATTYWGNTVSEYSLDDIVGWSDNPHWGYRGDITGLWGNTTDYGVYAEPLADALSQVGFNGDVFYAQGDASQLTSRIDAGIPTLVFVGLWGDQSIQETASDGTVYKVVAGDHALVAYGYNDDGVFMSDPASGGVKFMDWGTFMSDWNVLDGMGLGVTPAS